MKAIFTKTETQQFIKNYNTFITLHRHPFSGLRVDTCVQTVTVSFIRERLEVLIAVFCSWV